MSSPLSDRHLSIQLKLLHEMYQVSSVVFWFDRLDATIDSCASGPLDNINPVVRYMRLILSEFPYSIQAKATEDEKLHPMIGLNMIMAANTSELSGDLMGIYLSVFICVDQLLNPGDDGRPHVRKSGGLTLEGLRALFSSKVKTSYSKYMLFNISNYRCHGRRI